MSSKEWVDLLNASEAMVVACAKIIYGKLPVLLRINDDYFTHIKITDNVIYRVYPCKFNGEKCVDYGVWTMDILERIISCETIDVCHFYENCPFKEELKEAVKLYTVVDKIVNGIKISEPVNQDDIVKRVKELRAFAEIAEQMLYYT